MGVLVVMLPLIIDGGIPELNPEAHNSRGPSNIVVFAWSHWVKHRGVLITGLGSVLGTETNCSVLGTETNRILLQA